MKTFLWVLTCIGGIVGALLLFTGLTESNGAPQEAAVAAVSIALVVIPYCVARAASELGKKSTDD